VLNRIQTEFVYIYRSCHRCCNLKRRWCSMVVWWRCFTEAVYEHGNVGQLQKNGPRGHALEDMGVETGLLARPPGSSPLSGRPASYRSPHPIVWNVFACEVVGCHLGSVPSALTLPILLSSTMSRFQQQKCPALTRKYQNKQV
jgi:hypothetical protein